MASGGMKKLEKGSRKKGRFMDVQYRIMKRELKLGKCFRAVILSEGHTGAGGGFKQFEILDVKKQAFHQ